MKNSIVSWNKLVADRTAYGNSLREMFYFNSKICVLSMCAFI